MRLSLHFCIYAPCVDLFMFEAVCVCVFLYFMLLEERRGQGGQIRGTGSGDSFVFKGVSLLG